MSETIDPTIYKLKVVLLGVSSMIWLELLVRSDSPIANLHITLQITMGWTDTNLHRLLVIEIKFGHTNAAYSIQYARVTDQELADALDDR